MPAETDLICGEAERVGLKTQGDSFITHVAKGKKRVCSCALPDYKTAFLRITELIRQDTVQDPFLKIDLFAHRYVHPGRYFNKTTRVDKIVLRKLADTFVLAPIHNRISYSLIEACSGLFKKIPQYIVFDTSFHKTIPRALGTYALPRKLIRAEGFKKIGFHGISHKYVMEEACKFLGRNAATQRIISCHLGTGGASVCAIENGKSINSSMGFTPLEGLIMNTRCGDLDMGVVFYIMFQENFTPDQIDEVLNKKSGVLGIFNDSSDLRDVAKNMGRDPKAKMVFDMYVRRVKKYIGYYSLLLKKADIVIFTDSLGAGLPVLREHIINGFEFLGMKIDPDKNTGYSSGISDISDQESSSRILVVPTNEELMIAREAYKEHV